MGTDTAIPPDDDRLEFPELPPLEPGLVLLETPDARSTLRGALHALVVDHVLLENTQATWIDSRGFGSTRPLTDIAPSDRILDRIDIARGFTAYQHAALLETLVERLERGSEADHPGLIVVPALDHHYRDTDLYDGEGKTMLVDALATLAGVARRLEIPVLTTRVRDDTFAEPIANCASQHLECISTGMGPRFIGEQFETLVYPEGNGWVQTTLAFWEQVLKAREPLYRLAQPISPETTTVV